PELIARPDGDAREPVLERGPTGKTWQAAVRADKDVMSDLRHAVGWHMPVHNSCHVLLIPGDQLGKQVDLPMQHPVDNLEIIGHLCLHPNEAGQLSTACAPPVSYLTHERYRTRHWTDPRRAVASQHSSSGLQTFPCLTRFSLPPRGHPLRGHLVVSLRQSFASRRPGSMRIPRLFTDGLQFVTLFGREHRKEVSFRLDPHEPQVGFEGFALSALVVVNGEVRLLVPDERPQLSFRHKDISVRPNLRA